MGRAGVRTQASETRPGERTKTGSAETAWETVLESSVTTTEGVLRKPRPS